jgi:hypothetical protein
VTNAGGGGGTPATPDTVVVTPGPSNGSAVLIQYENQSEGMVARDLNMDMESKNITAESLKLRSGMTVETMQDFAAYHGVASEAELTAAMSLEVDREIDINLIMRVYLQQTGGNVNWDPNGYAVGDDNTFFRREYRKTLYESLVAANNLIYRKRFVDATWMIAGVSAMERLEKLERFKVDRSSPDDGQVSRIYQGTLDGKWKVFKDVRFPDDTIMLGFSGDSPFQQGAIYCPYVPAYMTDLLPDPSINFKVRKGLMSRFGFEIINPDCFSTVTIA